MAIPVKGPFVGKSVDTTGQIVARGGSANDRWATVSFTTATGVAAISTVAICHHQSYDIGNSLAIRYDSAQPQSAYEKDMAPSTSPSGRLVPMLLPILAIAVLFWRRSRGVPAAPRPNLVLAPENVDRETVDLDAELEELVAEELVTT